MFRHPNSIRKIDQKNNSKTEGMALNLKQHEHELTRSHKLGLLVDFIFFKEGNDSCNMQQLYEYVLCKTPAYGNY